MSDLLDLTSSPGSIIIHIDEILSKIGKEFQETTDPTKRESLLSLHYICMDICVNSVLTCGTQKDLEALLENRSRHFGTLLAWEASDSDGLVDPEKFERITAREIAAGRMLESDKMRKLAVDGAKAQREARQIEAIQVKPPAPVSGLRRIISAFKAK